MFLIAKSFILKKKKHKRDTEVTIAARFKGNIDTGASVFSWMEHCSQEYTWGGGSSEFHLDVRPHGLPPHPGLAEQGGCALSLSNTSMGS